MNNIESDMKLASRIETDEDFIIDSYYYLPTAPAAPAAPAPPTSPVDTSVEKKSLSTSTTTTKIVENNDNETNYAEANDFLEKETSHNKSCSWNKIDKTERIIKLKSFAAKYGKEHGYNNSEINNLKHFLISSLEKNKLQKAKDVIYDKEKKELISIPSLFFNPSSKNFTLKITDNKRVSTLKSLTPKRNSALSASVGETEEI